MFSNTATPNLHFSLSGQDIPITNSHKHLGVTFSKDAKWNVHIKNLISTVSKHINVLCKLKYKICRTTLENLYLVYIRPIFEYASEVWDSCGVVNANKLEQLQLENARIITGLPVFTNSELVYKELGWETIAVRRHDENFKCSTISKTNLHQSIFVN